jgi:hypothetical protein
MIRSYSELLTFETFEERFKYLQLADCRVGEDTFGFDRYLNQKFYKTKEWKRLRDHLIVRDNGCDLGVDGYDIHGRVIIHHMNPITKRDILDRSDYLMNPEYLICTTHNTHNAIHYGDENLLILDPIERTPNDTCLWKKQ